jgi:hypothetical protein
MNRDENMNEITYFKLIGEQISKMPKTIVTKVIDDLENHASDYAFDDGDLVHDLKRAIIEIKYANHIITELRERVESCESEIKRLEMLTTREN